MAFALLLAPLFQLGSSLVCTDFFRTGSPWTFPKDVFNVFGKDYFFVNQQLCQPVVPFLVFGQYFLGTFVLFINHLLHFFVNQFRSLFAIRAVEGIFLIIIIAEVG